ncbi:M61 family metallopeptidase [Acidicapsa dinghuensis]|uniref:M61 family metallopeptidase n=1 Tax=Acidicapsa dinghuensis TaxID=2218256 RepID=A0ABW1EMC8_9BACT|nr:M61 family peptidase [Acidicapsa dinghuensis]
MPGLKRCMSILLSTALALGAITAVAQTGETISLSVDATKTPQKLLRAEETLPVKPGPLTLYYPKWIPGEHGPDGPISSLTGLKFEADGRVIPWMRDTLDVFAFHLDVPAGVTTLHASYDYIEPEGGSATDTLLVLEWNEVTLYPDGATSDKLMYEASLKLPEGWKFGSSLSVASSAGNETRFKPISFELLVDSPVISGQYYHVIDLTPPGEPIHHELDLAADSEAALNISPEVQKGLTNVVAESGKLFGARHYRDYHFLLALSDHVAHFGLEHHESNDSRLPERVLISPGAAFMVGSLLPHEFVHSWNGKFRRPEDLTTPDFEKPMQDDLLWGYEGLTDYLGPMLAARSGLWTPEQYREYLASIAASLGPGRPGRTWRPLQDTATGLPMSGGRGWLNWRRSSDYYDEGDLLWLEVATIIHDSTHGEKSIDDFCHAFHGGANNGPEVKTYTFEQLVQSLNAVAPYNWAAFLRKRLDSTSFEAPIGGIENGGWKLVYNSQPIKLPGRRGGAGDAYSIGLQIGEDGTITDSMVGGPAFDAGITSGMKLVGVNGRVYKHDLLEDAIKIGGSMDLMVVIDDYYHTFTVKYEGGERYPHLERNDSKTDYLDELIMARVSM